MTVPSVAASGPATGPSVVVIGAGPRGVGWLERFAENQRHFDVEGVTIHLVDPFPPGAGRIWRYEQSGLLKLNSMAEDVTMFTDASSTIDGPIAPGPSLIEWAQDVREGRITEVTITDPLVTAELEGLQGKSFPTRRLQSLYLDWFYRRSLARLTADTTVNSHRDLAVRVDDLPDGRQRVQLSGGEALTADLVLYAVGHSGSDPLPEHIALAAFAARSGLYYLPPSFTADADLDGIRPGEPLIVRGFGLAAVDLLVLLGEGRGGRFERAEDGRLRYFPSGREPQIAIGSRRGIPYHSKITSSIAGDRPQAQFFTAEIAARIAEENPGLDFTAHIWPLIAKEMLHGYYAELFTGHPDRVKADWEEFSRRFALLDPFGDELRALTAETVIDPDDRLDLDSFDRPLAGVEVASIDELQETVRAYIRDDLDRRTLPEHSATLGLFLSLLQALFAFVSIVDSPNWTARSRERDLNGWWFDYFSYIASGPPGHRLEEILALSEAGVVTFLGAGIRVETDATAGLFRASGDATDHEFVARALVDAWLPEVRVSTSDNPVLRSLIAAADGIEQVIADVDYTTNTGKLTVERQDARLMLADGSAHPGRYAIGPYTTSPSIGAFSRPATNALSFRENDAVARNVLAELAARKPAGSAAVPEPAARTFTRAVDA